MRITKSMLRQIRIRLDERTKALWKLSDENLKNFLKTAWPNLTPGEREENLKMAVLLSIEEFIPESLTF